MKKGKNRKKSKKTVAEKVKAKKNAGKKPEPKKNAKKNNTKNGGRNASKKPDKTADQKIAAASFMMQSSSGGPGSSSSSNSDSVSPSIRTLRLLLLIGGVIALLLLLLASYRSVGYIAINQTYGCVQDDIDALSYINTMVDVDTGLILVDAWIVKEEIADARENIDARQCANSTSRTLASDLVEAQSEVEKTAVQYLAIVDALAENSTGAQVSEVGERYDMFKLKVAAFEEQVAEAEGRFWFAL
jgi:hypothetical protein